MRELVRVVNSTISTVPEVFLGKLQGLTDEEFELFKTLNRAIAELSGETCGWRRVSRGGILSTMNIFRTIRSLCPNKDTVIFEIGPGIGYLGALLGLAGYRYVATDVTQALYLYQSHLFETLFGSDFLEGAHIPRDEFDLDRALLDRRIVHMRW